MLSISDFLSTYLSVTSSPVSPIFSTHARKERELAGPGIHNHMHDIGLYTRVGSVAGRENCAWARTVFELSGSTRVKKKATLIVSELG